MIFIETLLVALSTYSSIPVPQFPWNEKNMRYAICCFPAVGLLCGGALYLWNQIAQWAGLGGILFAAVAACLPILLTGGIHMDGFMDTCDALASHQPRERKLEIMKDSHCGAFAVLYCAVYVLLHFGLFHEVWEAGAVARYVPAYVLSRILSALCAVTLPNARRAGMLCAFTEGVQKRKATAILLVLLALCAVPMAIWNGAGLLLALAWTVIYRIWAKKIFGGVTGDTAGFFLQISELLMLMGVLV